MIAVLHILLAAVIALVFGAIGLAFGLMHLTDSELHPAWLAAPALGGLAGVAATWALSNLWLAPLLGTVVPWPAWALLFALPLVCGGAASAVVQR